MDQNQIPEGALGALLQNPQIAAKLPRIMEALGPVLDEIKRENAGENAGEPPAQSEPDAAPEKPADGAETPARLLPAKTQRSRERAALLSALSPYLSDERRAALETVLKMSALLDVISEVL